MLNNKNIFAAFAAAVMLAIAAWPAMAKSPVVVELFTSQGCSSCPPAEAYLHDLAKRPDVIALEFHVDYWDYIGWKDPYGKREYTDRQHAYAESLGQKYVYTPQIVVNGAVHEVGSKRNRIDKIIDGAMAKQPAESPRIYMMRSGDDIKVRIDGKPGAHAYHVVFVSYDGERVTEVSRGENTGRTLVSANIVRDIEEVGYWAGGPTDYKISIAEKKGDGGCAILVQEKGHGKIVAAGALNY